MKKNSFVVICMLLSFFLFANVVNAANCSEEDIAQAKKVKVSMKLTSHMFRGEKQYMFILTANNLKSNMKATIDTCGEHLLTFTSLKNTQELYAAQAICDAAFKIVDTESNCTLRDDIYKIPMFNPYSQEAICEKYSDYKYCQERYVDGIDLEIVKKKINTLKKEDPGAAKSKKSVLVVFDNINITAALIIIASVLGAALIMIIVANIIIFKRKTKNR